MARFLFDNDIPYRIANALDELDGVHEVKAIRDVYGAAAKDLDWIPKAGSDGWIVISKDLRQTRYVPEKAALKAAKLTAVYLRAFFSNMRFWDQSAFIVRHWPALAGWAVAVNKGTIGEVQQNGRLNEKRL